MVEVLLAPLPVPEPENCYVVFHSIVAGIEVIGPLAETDMVARLADAVGSPMQAFIFRGERYHISKGPYRHLITPDGRTIPLVEYPTEIEIDPDGELCTDGDVPPPTPVKRLRPARDDDGPENGGGDDEDRQNWRN